MTDNDNLELKKRSRRRLVGAAALALFAAIVLPMVMDQEPALPTQDIHVSIPDRDADNLASRPIAGPSSSSAEPQLAPPPVEEAPDERVAATGAADEQAGKDRISSPAAAPSPAEAATSGPSVAQAETPPPRQSPASEPIPAADSTAKSAAKDEAARVRALLEGKASVAVAADQPFIVQVGAFGEADKASSLSSDLKKRGFAAYTEKAGGVTRVRVGPFANRELAEKTAERLRANGLNGVVAPR